MYRTPLRRSPSPDYRATSPEYRATSPEYRAHTPDYPGASPDYRATSPARPRRSDSRPGRSQSRPRRSDSRPGRSRSRPGRSSSRGRSPSRPRLSPDSRPVRSQSRPRLSPDSRPGRSQSRPRLSPDSRPGRSRSKPRLSPSSPRRSPDSRPGRSRSKPRRSPSTSPRRSPDSRPGRSRSKPRRSPSTSPRRSPDSRPGRSRSKPRRSPSTRPRHSPDSRPGRSRSRPRLSPDSRGRSRSRPRLSPYSRPARSRSRSPYSSSSSSRRWSRSPSKEVPSEHRHPYRSHELDLRRYSPSFHSDPASALSNTRNEGLHMAPDLRPLGVANPSAGDSLPSSMDRSAGTRGSAQGPDNLPGLFSSAGDLRHRPEYYQADLGLQKGPSDLKRPSDDPLPMPKKSILKKRPEPETTCSSPSTQIDSYRSRSNKDHHLLGRYTSSVSSSSRSSSSNISSQFPSQRKPHPLESPKAAPPASSTNLAAVTRLDSKSNVTPVASPFNKTIVPQAATPGNKTSPTVASTQGNKGNLTPTGSKANQMPKAPVSSQTAVSAEKQSNLTPRPIARSNFTAVAHTGNKANLTAGVRAGNKVPLTPAPPAGGKVTQLPRAKTDNKDHTLPSKKEIPQKGQASCSPAATNSSLYSQMGNFLTIFNKSACESQGIPYNPARSFLDIKRTAEPTREKELNVSHAPAIDNGNNVSPVLSKTQKKAIRLSEIEDEERFLYGDEEIKKPAEEIKKPAEETVKGPPSQALPQPAPEKNPEKQEYEKIHDLLKTIGLDIGITEIGKLAIRTQERLHGKKPTPQASEAQRSGSNTCSPDSKSQHAESPAATDKEQAPSASPAKVEPPAQPTVVAKKEQTPPVPSEKVEIQTQPSTPSAQPVQSPSPVSPSPVSPSQIPRYPPYPPTQMVPGYAIPTSLPPHSYNPYRPYVAYPSPNWPLYGQVHQPHPTHFLTSHMSVPPPTHMSVPPPTHVSVPPPTHVSVPPPTRVSVPPPTRVSVPPPTRVSVPPPNRVSVPPPAHVSVPPPAHVSVPPPAHVTTAPPPAHVTAAPPPVHVTAAPPPAHVTAAPPPAHVTAAPPPAHMTAAPPPAHMAAPPPAHVVAAPPPAHVVGAPPPAHVVAAPPPAHVVAAPPPAHVVAAPPPAHVVAAPPPAHVVAAPPSTHLSAIPRSNLCVIETSEKVPEISVKVDAPTTNVPLTTQLPNVLDQAEAELQNKEAEKYKVMEELDVLRIEQMKRRRNLATFVSKVEQLYIQQDILQKKRQPKDWHKDPLLEELYNVLQTAKRQIKILRSDFANASHKQRQLSAIANILGASPEEINEKLSAEETSNKQEKAAYPPKPDMHPKDSDSESKTSSNSKTSSDLKPQSYPNSIFDTKSKDIPRSGSDSRLGSSSNSSSSKEKSAGDSKPRSAPKSSTDLKYVPESKVSRSRDDSRLRGDKSRSKSPRPSDPSSKLDDNFPDMSRLLEYFDAENYWCEDCNTVCKTVSDFFSHLHNRKHTQTLNVWKRPWATPTEREARFDMRRKKVVVPLKGPEFLIPIAGFYCQLCQELIGDKICAEEHVKTFAHNQQYKDHIDANSFYEEKRSQNMKSGLAIISEMERKQQTEQKRKLEERTKEANEESAAKKSKKEEEESPKEKLKSPVVVSAKPDPRHSPKPEKEDPMKTPIFGRFTWKARDSKTQAAAASDNSNKEKEEENNGQVVKQKGIEIKLSGKTTIPHGSPWIASPSSSSTSPSSSSNASTSPSSLSQTKVRPNLPIPVTVLRKSSAAPVNKPAPLNTFLSIKSSGTSPKPLPVMKSIPEVALPQVVVSKAFGGQEVVVKETKEAVMQPDKIKPRLGAEAASSAQVTVCKSDERAPSMSECESNISGLPKPPPPRSGVDKLKAKTPDTYDMFSINDGKDSTVERKYGSVSLSQKVFRESSKKSEQKMENEKAATKLKESFSTPLPQVQKTDSPVSKDVGVALFSSSASQSNNDPSIKKPSVCENYGKLPSANKSSDQEARSVPAVGTIESKGNTASISDKGVLVEVSVSSSREAGKWEFLHPQYQKDKDSGAQKLIETKQSGFAYNRKDAVASSNQQTKPIHLPTSSTTACRSEPLFTAKPESNYSNTAKLNQKFKREPLPLPTSVFGRGPEMGRKDIKISSTGIQNSSTNKGKAVIKKQTPTSQEQPKVYTKTNKTVLQEELESYYKLIASEDDAEDVTTSEDQDAAMEAPVGIPCAPVPIKVKSLEKFVSVYPQPSIQLQTQSVLPDSSTEEPDDSDMACEEAPEVPGCASSFVPSRFSTTQLGHFGRRSYRSTRAIQKVPEATTIYTPKSPVKAVDRVPAKNYQGPVDLPAADYTMEDLSVLTTCDDLSD